MFFRPGDRSPASACYVKRLRVGLVSLYAEKRPISHRSSPKNLHSFAFVVIVGSFLWLNIEPLIVESMIEDATNKSIRR